MIDRISLLTLLNVGSCWCPQCAWANVDNVADAICEGHLVVGNDGDAITSLHLTPTGAEQLRMLPATTA